MAKKQRKRKPLFRRLLRGVAGLIIACMAVSLLAAWLPFARLPALDGAAMAALEARADEMARDQDSGDRAMLLETSQSALDERIRLIARAEREIVIATYECHDGESTRDILAAALERADAGVQVRFLVDGIAGRMDHMDGDLFCAVAAHPNVEVRFYNLLRQWTPWRHMGRMHDKYVIVDDEAYILGGRNMFDKFIGDYPHPQRSIDREALVYNAGGRADSSLLELRAYFEGMWSHEYTEVFKAHRRISEARRQAVYDALSARIAAIREEKPALFEPFDYAAVTAPTRGVWLVSNPTTVYAKQPVVFAQLFALMERARRDVVIHSPYAVLNADMRAVLKQLCAGRPVTLMVNAVGTGANLVASGDYLYHRNGVAETGVRLLEKCTGDSYHGKAIAIDDDIAIVGCFNLDIRSAYVDTELMLVIRSPEINARLRANMEALHADCREVTPAPRALAQAGVEADRAPVWKLAVMYLIGALIQPVRNLI